jgi:hypothetical protein
MPQKKKLKTLQEEKNDQVDQESSSDEQSYDENDESMSDCSDSDNDFDPNEEIIIDFEARDIDETDLNSINLLIKQKLSPFQNLSAYEIAKYLAEQKIGNVIYQANLNEDNDDDENESKMPKENDENNNENHDIFGVLSFLDLGSPKCNKIASNLKNFLTKECQKYDKQHKTKHLDELTQLLNNNKISYIVSERFINTPPAISVPMFESLLKDIDETKLEYDYWLFLSKIYDESNSNGNCSSTLESSSKMYSNPEEEVFEEMSEFKFEISYSNKASKNSDEPNLILSCFLLPKNKINDAITKIKSLIK